MFEALLAQAKSGEERDSMLSAYCYPLVALRRYAKARHIYASLFNKYGSHRYLHQLGMVEREAGNYRKALAIHQTERRMLRKSGALERSANLYELGKNNELLGKTALAAKYAADCRAEAMRCRDLVMKGCAFRLSGDVGARIEPASALRYYARARQYFKRAGCRPAVKEVDAVIRCLQGQRV